MEDSQIELKSPMSDEQEIKSIRLELYRGEVRSEMATRHGRKGITYPCSARDR